MKDPSKRNVISWWLWLILLVPVIWLAIKIAACLTPGANLFTLVDAFTESIQKPFVLEWTDKTAACILVAVLLYGFGIAIYLGDVANRRPREEHGSAKWGSQSR